MLEDDELSSKKRRSKQKKKEDTWRGVLVMAIGFVLAIYGFLVLVFPQNYPIGSIPYEYTPLAGIILMITGIFLLLWKA
jgi:protein-S-isoprenylcysteine O-methyltransferase Ste14